MHIAPNAVVQIPSVSLWNKTLLTLPALFFRQKREQVKYFPAKPNFLLPYLIHLSLKPDFSLFWDNASGTGSHTQDKHHRITTADTERYITPIAFSIVACLLKCAYITYTLCEYSNENSSFVGKEMIKDPFLRRY